MLRHRVVWFSASLALIIIAAIAWFRWREFILFFPMMHHLNKQQERVILYNTDHMALGRVLRQFGDKRKWAREDLSADSPQIPEALRVLKPTAVWMFQDHIELEFGGPFGDIGFRAFRPGLKGYRTKEPGDGLWLYTEDGCCPKPSKHLTKS